MRRVDSITAAIWLIQHPLLNTPLLHGHRELPLLRPRLEVFYVDISILSIVYNLVLLGTAVVAISGRGCVRQMGSARGGWGGMASTWMPLAVVVRSKEAIDACRCEIVCVYMCRPLQVTPIFPRRTRGGVRVGRGREGLVGEGCVCVTLRAAR